MAKVVVSTVIVSLLVTSLRPSAQAQGAEWEVDTRRGIVAVLGMPEAGADAVVRLAVPDERIVYFQSASSNEVSEVREAAASDLLQVFRTV